jgi:hypothetical protein
MARGFWNRVTLHPLLFAVHPALFLYAHNLGQLEFVDVVRSAAWTLLFAALGFSLFYVLLRDVHKCALGVSISLLLYFSLNRFWSLFPPSQLCATNLRSCECSRA